MDLDKIKIKVCEGVYGPREDSYLLADAVEKYAFGDVLDLGTGSGILGIVAARKGCKVTFADISKEALECARKNAEANGIYGSFIESNMFSNIDDKFNTIIFNPPYLPSDDIKDVDIDGGKDGRKYIDEFLNTFRGYLKDRYVVLLLESSFNNYEQDLGKGAKLAASGHFFFEDLVVMMFGNI
jgi:release factor glutamine methyltransferase